MKYEEALKLVQTKKPKDNYMLIEMAYDRKLLLPYKDAITLLSSLANAEQLNERYNEPHRIIGLERDSINTRIFSHEEYERYKIAALLNITPDEVKEHMKEAA